MKKITTIAIAAFSVLIASAARAQHQDDHDHAEHNDEKKEAKEHEGHEHAEGRCEHGTKRILTIKEAGIIEFAHDAKDGEVVLTILDTGKKALKPTKAPRLNLIVKGARKQVKTKELEDAKEGNVFAATNDLLKGELNGGVAIKIGDKKYDVPINPQSCTADHDHNAHGHGAHDH